MMHTSATDLLFDDISALMRASDKDMKLLPRANNDCDCVSYGPTSNHVQIDTEEITRIAHQEY